MAVRYACDGCGEMLPDASVPVQLGLVLKREYCAQCAPMAEGYMTAVNDAHTSCSAMWLDKLSKIRASYPDLQKLPDVY